MTVLGSALLASSSAYAGLPSLIRSPTARPDIPASKHTIRYNKKWRWVSHDLHICVKFIAYGEITYRTRIVGTDKVQKEEEWIDQTVHDPTLKEVTYKAGCKIRRSVMSIAIGQHWTGFACSFNPSISINAGIEGLSVTGSAWPSCGQRNQAIYSTSYGRGTHHTQFNSGSPIGFGEYHVAVSSAGLLGPIPCYGVFPSADVYANGNSDSFGAGKLKHAQKVCLPAN